MWFTSPPEIISPNLWEALTDWAGDQCIDSGALEHFVHQLGDVADGAMLPPGDGARYFCEKDMKNGQGGQGFT